MLTKTRSIRSSLIAPVENIRNKILVLVYVITVINFARGDLTANLEEKSRNSERNGKFSQPIYSGDGFHPMLVSTMYDAKKLQDKITNELFTEKGQFKVFVQDDENKNYNDLRFSTRLPTTDGTAITATKPDELISVEDVTSQITVSDKEIDLKSTTDSNLSQPSSPLPSIPSSILFVSSSPTVEDERPETSAVPKINIFMSDVEEKSNVLAAESSKNNEKGVDLKSIEKFLLNYIEEALESGAYELFSELSTAQDNFTAKESSVLLNGTNNGNVDLAKHLIVSPSANGENNFDEGVKDRFRRFAEGHVINVSLPRAVETGRLFFFKGLKKILWPVFIGVQIAKTILLALFLPSILGSLGKIVGKGITSVSGFNQPSETVDDLDFKDNTYNFDQDGTYNDYAYQQPEASTNNFAAQMYDAATANNNVNSNKNNNNDNVLQRFGLDGQKITYVNSPIDFYTPKNNNMAQSNAMQHQQDAFIGGGNLSSKKNNFKVFQDIPASSLLLTNYDPFYSPLLSRLDAVFQQLGLGSSGDERCREKVICLMYGSPAKYAPYSNLVSAQLSRELNELRKPTSDNPDILRFFKYMKAAKDGQDGMNCEHSYIECTNFKDSDNPAMLTTFNDINKLVQARKI